MVSRFVATWRNIGNAGMLDAYNRGAALATRQITSGLGGVGDAIDEYGNKVKTRNTGDILAKMAAAKDQAALDAITPDNLNVDNEKIAKARGDLTTRFTSVAQFNQTAENTAEHRMKTLENQAKGLENQETSIGINQGKLDLDNKEFDAEQTATTKRTNALQAAADSLFSPATGSAQGETGTPAPQGQQTDLQKYDAIKAASSKLTNEQDIKDFQTIQYNKHNLSSNRKDVKANQTRQAFEDFVTETTSIENESKADMDKRVDTWVKNTPGTKPSDFRGAIANEYVDVTANNILEQIGTKKINDELKLTDGILNSYGDLDSEGRDEVDAKMREAGAGIQDTINAVNKQIGSSGYSPAIEKRIVERVTGDGSPLGNLKKNYDLLKSTKADIDKETAKVAKAESKANKKAFDAFKLANTASTFKSWLRKENTDNDMSDEIKDVAKTADEIVRLSGNIFRDRPHYVYAAMKENTIIKQGFLHEFVRGDGRADVLERSMQLLNAAIAAGKDVPLDNSPASKKALAAIEAIIYKKPRHKTTAEELGSEVYGP